MAQLFGYCSTRMLFCCNACVLHRRMCCVQVMSYIWPSGKKSYTLAPAERALVKGKVPYFLAHAWNR